MGALDNDVRAHVKGSIYGDWKASGYAADIDIFGAEQEKPFLFQDVSHIIIRAISAVGYEDAESPVRLLEPLS